MDKDNDFDLQQLKAKSSAELLQKYKIKRENDKALNRSKGSNSNKVKNQHVGSTQQHPICLSQTIGIDEGRIQKGLGKSTNTTPSLTIGGVPIPVRGSAGSLEAQNKRKEQMKSSLNIKTTQVAHQKDLAKSTSRTTQVAHQKGLAKSTSRTTQSEGEFNENTSKGSQRATTNRATTNVVQSELQSLRKQKYIPKCPSMSLGEFIEKNQQPNQGEESEEESDHEQGIEGDVNYGSEEVGEFQENTSKGETSKRTRGKTLCVNIHTRSTNDREEIILNELGQPIGPNARILSQFSNFLGTIARSSDFCPLIYTNWKAIPEKDKNIWAYVNEKYNVPEKGKKVVYSIIDEAWRRYKWTIKRKHFSPYKTLRERLKNRPDDIPEEHFKELMVYWSLPTVQETCQQNAQNIAQQTCRHRAGPVSFARIRETMCASSEDGEPPSQVELFIETRQSKKGEQLNEDTNDKIIKLKDLVSSGQSSSEAFQKVVGKEKAGRVRTHGRAVTATMLKRNEELTEIKKAHANHVEQLKEEHANHIKEIEEKLHAKLEEKFQLFAKAVLDPSNSRLNVEALAAMFTTPPNATSAPRSSTSTHAPEAHRENDEGDEGLDGMDDEEFEDIC